MACVWIEGFESHLNFNQMARKYAATAGSFASDPGRVFGTAAEPVNAVYITPSFGTDNIVVLGFGFKLNAHFASLNTGNQGFYIETGVNEQIHLEMESTSGSGVRFLLKRGATILNTSAYQAFGVWMYIELKVTVRSGVNGAYELRINGVTEFSATGVDTAANGTDGWDVFAQRWSANYSTRLVLDDIYVLNGTTVNNNDFLGPSVVEGLLPNAIGSSTQWTQNGAGANYTSVDDIGTANPVDVGTGGNVGSDVNTQKDMYNLQDLQQISGTIHAVQLGLQMAMAAAGNRTVKSKYRDPSTVEVDGASHVVDATTYDEFTEVFDLNPQTGLAWDVADIDGGQFGVEVVS